jgi:hypothetical protein
MGVMGSLRIDPLSSDGSYSLRVAMLTAQAFWPSHRRFWQNSTAMASKVVSAWMPDRTFSRGLAVLIATSVSGMTPGNAGCSGRNRGVLGRSKAQIPPISNGFIDFPGLCGKGGLEVKGSQ